MSNHSERVESHYTDAAGGFETWSDRQSLHYGYWTPDISPLDREAMLERMNETIYQKCERFLGVTDRVVDAGCGFGSTCRTVAQRAPDCEAIGVTNSARQAKLGTERFENTDFDSQVTLLYGDYRSIPLPGGCADAVYALESTAYAPEASKRGLLEECYRLTRPGGVFVFADVFLKRDRPLPPILRTLDRRWHECGETEQVGNLGTVRTAARDVGFENVDVEDVSWNVAPSMCHIPGVALSLVVRNLLDGQWLNEEEKKFTSAILLSTVMGLFRTHYGYYVVSGRRPSRSA